MSADPFLPPRRTLPALRRAVQGCRGCPLYARATQAVFGLGRAGARMMLVGEQPGNEEDLAGAPFVGPSGRWLDAALQAAGIDRRSTFVTNAVKHFKWEPAGGKRRHKKPSAGEVRACRPWLEAEIAAVRPTVIVALGATAAQSLFGAGFRVTRQRGIAIATPLAPHGLATIHPAAILRQRTSADRERENAAFIADLKAAQRLLRQAAPSARRPRSRDQAA